MSNRCPFYFNRLVLTRLFYFTSSLTVVLSCQYQDRLKCLNFFPHSYSEDYE